MGAYYGNKPYTSYCSSEFVTICNTNIETGEISSHSTVHKAWLWEASELQTIIKQAYSSFLQFILTHLWMQIWNHDWLVTLSRSHADVPGVLVSLHRRGLNQWGSSILTTQYFNNHEAEKKDIFQGQTAHTWGRRVSATRDWGQAQVMYHSSGWLLTGTGQIRLAPCFRKGITWTS